MALLRRTAWSTIVCTALFFLAWHQTALAARPDQIPSDTVGSIEGDSISVEGPMAVRVVNGTVKTILRSGSDIHVKSGRAQIDLVEGGRIVICGPAHLTILKSGGALTLALDSGTVHAYVNHGPALTVYTPQIQAQPIAIGEGAQDALVGFDSPRSMCVRARSGAIRLEQQLTGQTLVVPEGGDVLLANGQLDGVRVSAGKCSCELEEQAKASPPPNQEVSLIASAKDLKQTPEKTANATQPAATAAAPEQPIYKVFMPPLQYDASAKIQDAPDPHMIVMVRSVRVRPTLIYESRVEGDPVIARATPLPEAPKPPKAEGGKKPPQNSTWSRLRSFLQRLWSHSS